MINTHKDYLSYNNGQLYYKNINLLSLIKKYGHPLKVGYTDMIREKVQNMQNLFNKTIKKHNYNGKYFYANANKASYYAENVITACSYADFIETSSLSDLEIVKRIISKKIIKNKKIICNGIKDDEYLSLIFKMVNDGYNILNIIDNLNEFEKILNHPLKHTLEIGVRVKLENIYNKNPKIAKYDRFGLYETEINYIINTYKKNPLLKLNTIHYHQRGSLFNQDKFLTHLKTVFNVYANAYKQDKNIIYLNIGGGCPYSKIDEYDYESFVNLVVKTLKTLSFENKVAEPNIIQENGRYTVSDSCFNIYKINNVKDDDIPWYVVNDSFITSLPNTWALGEEFLILPINLAANKLIPVRLAGNTCDCDDVYYYQNNEEILLPEIKEGEELFIGIFGMGAYQEILSGIGGIHHCLNREENDLIIYKKNNKDKFYNVRKSQSIKYIFKRLLYQKHKDLHKFKQN